MLQRLVLNNFRNYNNLVLDIGDKNNILIGENGQGKSNFLEAIYFSSMLRSFRTSRINDLKNIDSKDFFIGLLYNDNDNERSKLTINYQNNRKHIAINDVKISKTSQFINRFKTVVFAPNDINIITGNALQRRRFIDILIIALEAEAINVMYDYNMALKQRNALLRRGSVDLKVYTVFDEIIAENGVKIAHWRKYYLQLLFSEIYELLVNSDIRESDYLFTFIYLSDDIYQDKDKFKALLERNFKRDLQRKQTCNGVHLDDVDFLLNGKLLRKFGSNGQCRMLSLIIKMAQLKLLTKYNNDNREVVVLIDDVTGDLDDKFRALFFDIIKVANQTFFTFTDESNCQFIENNVKYKVINNDILRY